MTRASTTPRPRKLCYVASPSYSGSTLLTFLIGTHPDVSTVGELKGRLYASLETPKRCSCGSAVVDCPFWNAVKARLVAHGAACDLEDIDAYFHAPGSRVVDALLRARVRGPLFEAVRDAALRVWPGARRELARLVERNRLLADAICAVQGGDVLLDSSKDATRLKFLADSGAFDLHVLHLLRDGRGTANSFRKRDRHPVERGARRWRSAHESFLALFERIPPERVLRVHYEDLARDPRGTVDAVLGFLGLATGPEGGASLDWRGAPHHVFGNEMRLAGSSEIRLDESWRDELSPADLAAFARAAGSRNRAFGYEP